MSFAVLEFKTVYKGDKSTDYVLIAPRGEGFERVRTWHRVDTLKPSERVEGQMGEIMQSRWNVIEPAYNAWKKGEEVPENGTPLGAWAAVSLDQAKHLRSMGIVTVEQVAKLDDATISALPFPGRRELPALAEAFLDSKSATDLAAQNHALQERIAAMEEMLTESMGEKKRGPGRPRKNEAA